MTTVFLPWIYENIDKLDMAIVSKHPEAVPYFKENPNKIDWNSFSANPAAINMIQIVSMFKIILIIFRFYLFNCFIYIIF